MINHVRTLFINDRWAMSSKYVEPNFSPVVLPAALQQAHRLLLPDAITAEQLNDLVDSYVTGLHQGEYADNLLELDSRITYTTEMVSKVPDPSLARYSSSAKFFVDKIPGFVFIRRKDYRDAHTRGNTFYDRFAGAFLGMVDYMNELRGDHA